MEPDLKGESGSQEPPVKTAPDTGKKVGSPRSLIRLMGILILVIVGLVYYRYFGDQIEVLATIRPGMLWLLGITSFLMVITTGLTNALLVKILDVRLTFWEYSSLSFLTTFANYFGPFRAGAAVRAAYLRIEKDLPVSSYAGVMVANSLLLCFVSGITGLLLLGVGYLQYGILSPVLILSCLGFVGTAVLAKVVRLPAFEGKGRITNMARLAASGLNTIRTHHMGLLEVVFSILMQYIAAAAVIYAAYGAIGTSIGILPAFIIGIFNAMAGYLSITPNNLGLQEAAIGYLGTVSGLGLAESLLAAALIRIGQVTVVFLFVPVCWLWLLKPAGIDVFGKVREPEEEHS